MFNASARWYKRLPEEPQGKTLTFCEAAVLMYKVIRQASTDTAIIPVIA